MKIITSDFEDIGVQITVKGTHGIKQTHFVSLEEIIEKYIDEEQAIDFVTPHVCDCEEVKEYGYDPCDCAEPYWEAASEDIEIKATTNNEKQRECSNA